MGGGNWRHATATAALLAVLLTGCSPDDIGELPPDTETDLSADEPTTTTVEETTTSASTSTTLSATDVARAEIEQLIFNWWTQAYDGEGTEGATEYLTGLIETRISELAVEEQAQGLENTNTQNSVIDITSIDVDLDEGTAEATSCTGSAITQIDTATNEIVFADNPDFLFTSDWVLELTDDGWKIAEWFPSANGSDPELCTIQG